MIAEPPFPISEDPQAVIRLLQDELASTNQEVLALTLDLESRVEERTRQLHEAQEELQKTNSELMQLALELEERAARLELANKELETFSYSVSHDLRAPVRGVNGFLNLLREHLGESLDAESGHYITKVLDASRRMGQLIDDLLNFSRLGRQEMMQTCLDLNPLVASVIEELNNECTGRRIRWKLEPLPTIHADASLMRAVFQNLLGNALKFTRGKGEAQIEVCSLEANQGELRIMVKDNGAGFDPAYAHKLFGVFQRLHRKDEFEGTGIGLANVKRIITRHGGRVEAEGALGEGATFFLVLPGLKAL